MKLVKILSSLLSGLVQLLPISDIYKHKISVTFAVLLMRRWSLRYAKQLHAQAAHETGNFKSNILKMANNTFGMKKVMKRQTTQEGVYSTTADDGSGNGNYGKYPNIVSSYVDRILWDDDFGISYKDARLFYGASDSASVYMNVVASKGYALDASYLDKWSNLYLNIKSKGNRILTYQMVWFPALLGILLSLLLTYFVAPKWLKSTMKKYGI